jgi:acetoin utilization deacetylase AcuC-like enzyme
MDREPDRLGSAASRWVCALVSAGFDTFKHDPIGAFMLENADYHALGERLGNFGLPTTVVQEGGYFTDALGPNVSTFLHGVRDGLTRAATAS